MEASGSNVSKERQKASSHSAEEVGNFDFDDLQRRHREMHHSSCSSRHTFSKSQDTMTLQCKYSRALNFPNFCSKDMRAASEERRHIHEKTHIEHLGRSSR